MTRSFRRNRPCRITVIGRVLVIVPMKAEEEVYIIPRVENVSNRFFGKNAHLRAIINYVQGKKEEEKSTLLYPPG